MAAVNRRFLIKNGLDNNSQTIQNVASPVNATDAATRAYVLANVSTTTAFLRTATLVAPTAGTTVFTIAYTAGYIDVFQNGVKLVLGDDFTATNGTSVTLTNATLAGDSVEFVIYPVNSNTVYTKTEVDNLLPTKPYVTTTYSATVTPTTNTNVRIIATGALTINAPTSGVDGDFVRMWISASGVAIALSLQGTIVIPTSSTFTSPQTIAIGKKARLTIQYDATRTAWEIVTFVNGY